MTEHYSTFGGIDTQSGALAWRSKNEDHPEGIFMPGKRRRVNLLAIVLNLLAPWSIFTVILCVMSFSLHYNRPLAAWLTSLSGFLMAALCWYLAYRARKRDSDPMWYTFAAVAIFIAAFCGTVLGDVNFRYHMQPYYDMENLNTYPSVNPAQDKGQQLMDAGRVYFTDGTELDMGKSMSFQNLDLYCVAPIVNGGNQPASYDFWAVGMNCCPGEGSMFRCGEYNNPYARSGFRLLRDEQRPFYRLAVQQAEAAYNIKSVHPLFFIWTQDPVAMMNKYRSDGYRLVVIAIATYFVFNLACITGAVISFSKIGRYHDF